MTSINKYFTVILVILFCSSTTINSQELPDSVKSTLLNLNAAEQIKYLKKICWNNREKNTNLAILYGKRALQISDSIRVIDDAAELNNYVGVCYIHYNYNINKAIPYFHNALETALIVNDTIQIGYSYNNLADAYYKTNNIPLAMEYSKISLNYFESINNQNGIAYTLVNIGIIYKIAKEYNRAFENYANALEIRVKENNKNGMAYIYFEIADTYNELDQLDSAIHYYEKSLSLHKEIDNKRYIAHCLNGMGKIHYKQGEYASALNNFEKAYQINFAARHHFGKIDNLIGRALIASQINDIADGKEYLAEALHYAQKLGYSSKITAVHLAAIEFYSNIGEYKTAAESMTKYIEVYDSLLSNISYQTVAETKKRLEINEHLLDAKSEIKIRQKEEIYLYLTISLFLLMFVVIIWRFRIYLRLNRKLKESNQAKDKLFSIIAHDLKNPFLSLKGYISFLKEEKLSEKERKECIEHLDAITNNTYELLENLLNLSASKIGKISYYPTIFDINELIEDVCKIVNPALNKKSIMLKIYVTQDQVCADRDMLEIILRNLITNAVKYSNNEGEITIKSIKVDDTDCIEVIDKGVGMEQDVSQKLFSSDIIFSQSGTSGERGTGLGLSLCKEFIDKHNGKIEVESELGKGSLFRILLPNKNSLINFK